MESLLSDSATLFFSLAKSLCALSLFRFPVSRRVFQFIGYYRTKPAEQRLIGMPRRNNKAAAAAAAKKKKKKDDEFSIIGIPPANSVVAWQLPKPHNNEINEDRERQKFRRCKREQKERERLTGKSGFRVGTSGCQSNLKRQTNKDISNQQQEPHQGQSMIDHHHTRGRN